MYGNPHGISQQLNVDHQVCDMPLNNCGVRIRSHSMPQWVQLGFLKNKEVSWIIWGWDTVGYWIYIIYIILYN